MARLTKRQLFQVVETAVRDSGWNLLMLTARGEFPARYRVFRDASRHTVRVYIWNLTHGGGRMRPSHEYRIQVTSGVTRFEPEPHGETVILGWWDEIGVFAGFDYAHHTAPLGASPSIQIGEQALRQAEVNGFTPHNKGNGELAIAFRPDFIGTYIDQLKPLHGSGNVEAEVEVLSRLAEDPESINDAEIMATVAKQRRHAIRTTRRALRDIRFRNRVLTAYKNRCGFCGLQLRLLDAVSHPAGRASWEHR